MSIAQSIFWRRLDVSGHEAVWLHDADDGYRLRGLAVFADGDDATPCALCYDIACDRGWVTQSLRLIGRRGPEAIDLTVTADEQRKWLLDGRDVPAVAGCVEIDLSFSAATNTFPIRRLALAVGQSAEVTSAWLTFPQLRLEPLRQVYRRTGESTYEYQSPTANFVTQLRVSGDGWVTDYPPLWTLETRVRG